MWLDSIATDFLPPATKLGQCYVFTGVCDSVNGGGCLPQCMLGYHHPLEQTHPWEQTPPGADPPAADTPLRADTPLGADTPGADTPHKSRHRARADTPQSRHPPGADTPPEQTSPPQSMLGDTVNARAVRILLECNLF